MASFLLLRDVTSTAGDSEVGPHLFRSAARHVQEMGEVTIGLLSMPFADQRRNSCRRLVELPSQLAISAKAAALAQCRNCIGRRQWLLINLQILEPERRHDSG